MRDKLGRFVKGNKPQKPFQKGNIPWNISKKCPQISKALTGHYVSEESKEKMRGKRPSISGSKNPMWKGGKKTYCIDCGKQITNYTYKRCKPCADKDKKGKPIWKGDDVGYGGVHDWVRANKGKPQVCEHCGKIKKEGKIEWANTDHKYKRKLEDYISLCTSCHRKYDKKNV